VFARRPLWLAAVVLGLAGCSSPALPPPWPASSDIDLQAEIASTALEQRAEGAPVDAAPIEGAVSPLVAALEGEAAGLSYIEVVLGDVDVDASLPMVLMLHGRGDRPRVPGGPFGCVEMPMRIVMPRGPDPLGPGYTWLSTRVAEGRVDEISGELAARADQLAGLLEEVSALRPTLGHPIVTGFSQGGLLSFALAVRHPALVAAAFPLAGWLPPPLWPDSAEGLPVIRTLHGMTDDIIPLAPTREAVAHLADLGADIELLEFSDVGHTMSGPMNQQFERWLEQALRLQAPDLANRPRDTEVELGDLGEVPPPPCEDPAPDAEPHEADHGGT